MKKIIFIFFVCILFVKVNAQNQIKGNVLDAKNEPLIGASVFIPELNKGTITDQAGHYLFTNVPTGKSACNFHIWGITQKSKQLKLHKLSI